MLRAPLARLSEPIYAIFRIVFGALFAVHGAQKVLGVLGGQQMPVGSMPWIAGVIELVGGVMIAIGLLAGLAAFIASEDGANLVTAYRRASNIVAIEEKKDKRSYGDAADPGLLGQPEERALHAALAVARTSSEGLLGQEAFG